MLTACAAISRKLGELGYDIALNYRSNSSRKYCDEIAAELKEQYGTDTLIVKADVGSFEGCKTIVDAAVEHFGDKIDVLVNNAGVSNHSNWIDIEPAAYENVINLFSVMHMTHLVLPYMVNHSNKENQCSIVSISSVGGLKGMVNLADYCASKAGVIGHARALAVELADRSVRVNVVAPGMTMTDMLGHSGPERLAAIAASIPMGHIGEPSDIAGAVEYILAAPYLTGQVISPNGGAY